MIRPSGRRAPSRTCACNVDHIVLAVRVFASLGWLATMAASAWGFLLANDLYNQGRLNLVKGLTTETLGVYVGLVAVYQCSFGLLGFLGEVRTPWLKKTILRPFGFLTRFVGRAVFLAYVGTTFLLVPWDEERQWVNKTPASMLIASSFAEGLIALFITHADDMDGGGAGGPPKNEAASIAWGEADGTTVPDVENPVASSSSSSSRGGGESGGSDPPLLRSMSAADPALANASNAAGVGGGAVIVKNPFAVATGT
jgi:hypothetical protein